MREIAIFGAGGFGREVACLIRMINESRQEPEWNVAWQYGCRYVCMVLTIVAVISRLVNPMGILKKMNAIRCSVKKW